VQVRGAFTSENVVPALCSAFVDGKEPAECANEFGEDLCSPGSVGFQTCRTGYFAAAGRTRCERTFEGFHCVYVPLHSDAWATMHAATQRAQWQAGSWLRCGGSGYSAVHVA
jgi:hypothetical protein